MLYIKYSKVYKSHLSCKFNKLKENLFYHWQFGRAVARLLAVGGKGNRIDFLNFCENFDEILRQF